MNYELKQPKLPESHEIQRLEGVLNGQPVYSPEPTEEYYDSQIAFHQQIVESLEAQKAKLVEFKGGEEYVEEINSGSEAEDERTQI